MKNVMLYALAGIGQILCLVGLIACMIKFMTVEADLFYVYMGAALASMGLFLSHITDMIDTIGEDDDTNN